MISQFLRRSVEPGGWFLGALLFASLSIACNGDPGDSDQTPLYRAPGEEGTTSGERGKVLISEIHYAGSVRETDQGTTHFWNDVFIEFRNKSERKVDLTGWRIRVRGDRSATYVIPETDPIGTNEFFVVARREDGAFGDVADVFIEDLDFGKKNVFVQLVDRDERLMEVVGSREQRAFAGGWDTVSARSMERVQLLFSNSGTKSRSWHTYSAPQGFGNIREDYRKFTLASPGEANSTDYSGSTSSGNLD